MNDALCYLCMVLELQQVMFGLDAGRASLIVEVVIPSTAFRRKNCTILCRESYRYCWFSLRAGRETSIWSFFWSCILWFPLNRVQSRAPSGNKNNRGLLKGSTLLCLWARLTCLGNLLVRWLRLFWSSWFSGIHKMRLDHVLVHKNIDILQESHWNLGKPPNSNQQSNKKS